MFYNFALAEYIWADMCPNTHVQAHILCRRQSQSTRFNHTHYREVDYEEIHSA